MSALPEGHGQEGPPPNGTEHSGSPDGVRVAGINGVSYELDAGEDDEIEHHANGEDQHDGGHLVNGGDCKNAASGQVGQGNSGYNISDTEGEDSDIKRAVPRLPATQHQNTPASTGSPVRGGDHKNGTSSQAAQTNSGYNIAGSEGEGSDLKNATSLLPTAQHPNTPVTTPGSPSNPGHVENSTTIDGVITNGAITDGVPGPFGQANNTNGDNDDGEPSTEPGTTAGDGVLTNTISTPHLPTSRHSHVSTEPAQGSAPQEASAEQAGNTGYRHSPPRTTMPSNQSSGSITDQGSQADDQGQDIGDRTNQSQSEGSNLAGQDTVALATPGSEGDDPHGRQVGHDIGEVSGGGDEEAASLSDMGQGGLQTHHREPDQGVHNPPQSGHIDAASQLFTSSGPLLPESPRPGSRSSLNPIATPFIPRPEHSGISREFTLPIWQPDSEVTNCPICHVQFGMFLRKHHCRKCGRVVCDRCSPHRITIPHAYIVRPPGDQGPAPPYLYPGVEGGLADFSSVGGGERVRLCNPCVPDPNTAPPQAQPLVVDGRASRARPPSNSFGGHGANPLPLPHSQLSSQHHNQPRHNRSASTSIGQTQSYHPFIPFTSTSSQYPSPASAYVSQSQLHQHRVSSNGFGYPHHIGNLRISSSSQFTGLDRPLPRIPTPQPEIPDEDACPVCHNELPPRFLPNYEVLRETHINNCIMSHSNYGSGHSATPGLGSHGTPPPRTTRRTRMFPYVATEKDCVGDTECTICLEEFKVGDAMARLECFCRFHRSCIDSWFVNHPGRCPIHQHDSFGY